MSNPAAWRPLPTRCTAQFSNLGYTFTPGGASIELIPIVVGTAAAALLAGVVYGVLARRVQIGARRTSTNA